MLVCASLQALKCRTAGWGCQLAADNALSDSLRQPTLQHTGITYFSGAFVFDGELALLFAVIDVAQLVVKQIRGRCREPGKKHREEGRQAVHPAAEPEHLKPWRRGAESRASTSTELPLWRRCWCGCCCCCCLSPGPVCSADLPLLVASRASSSSSSSRTSCSPQTHTQNLQSSLHCSAQCGSDDIHKSVADS